MVDKIGGYALMSMLAGTHIASRLDRLGLTGAAKSNCGARPARDEEIADIDLDRIVVLIERCRPNSDQAAIGT
jgi:hypothetical protein